jgi:hypothetical protein
MTEKYLLKYRLSETSEWLSFPFSGVVMVGSSTQNDLTISDGDLSDQHFELRENPTGLYLKDVDPEKGETRLAGESLVAHRPTELMLNQSFKAGQIEFKVELNIQNAEQSQTNPLAASIREFGVGKTIGIGLAVALIAFVGGFLLYRFLLRKPVEISDVLATEVNEAASEFIEVAGTLVPTELFELSSTAVVEAVDTIVTAPGMGDFSLEEMVLDISSMDINNLMELSSNPEALIPFATTIVGENVGYVYSYTGIHQDGRVIATGMEFIEAPEGEIVDGVEIPAWDQAEIPVEILWQPVVHYLEDEVQRTLVLLQPTIYGASKDDQIYTVEGIYQQQEGADKYSAIVRFRADGSMIDILTFGKVDSERQTPYKVNFSPGDTFSPYEMEFIHDEEKTVEMAVEMTGGNLPVGWDSFLQILIGNMDDGSYQFGIGEFDRHEKTTLTLAESGIRWTTDDNPRGEFVTGIAVEDLDGNLFVGYIPILVKP